MKTLLWKEYRELRIFAILFVIAFLAAEGLCQIPLFAGFFAHGSGALFPFGTALIAVALGADAFVRERRARTLDYVLSRPISAQGIVWAKFLVGSSVVLLAVGLALAVLFRQGENEFGRTVLRSVQQLGYVRLLCIVFPPLWFLYAFTLLVSVVVDQTAKAITAGAVFFFWIILVTLAVSTTPPQLPVHLWFPLSMSSGEFALVGSHGGLLTIVAVTWCTLTLLLVLLAGKILRTRPRRLMGWLAIIAGCAVLLVPVFAGRAVADARATDVVPAGVYSLDDRTGTGLAADGNLVWVSKKNGFVVIDFSDAPHPKRLAEGQLPLWDIAQVGFGNNFAYAAGRRKEIPEDKSGILCVSLDASDTPLVKQVLDFGRARDYPWFGKPIIVARHLYIGTRSGAQTTLRVFEISPEGNARQTASLPLEKWEGDYLPSSSIGFDLLIRGRYAYVAGFTSLFTLDLQDPGRPRIVHEQGLDGGISPHLPRHLVSLGDRLYVDGLWPPRLMGFDLRDPARPVMRSESPTGLLLQGEIAASVDSKVLFRPYGKGVLAFEPPSGWLLHGVRYLKVNPESCPAGCRLTSTVVGRDYFYELVDEKQVAAYPLKP